MGRKDVKVSGKTTGGQNFGREGGRGGRGAGGGAFLLCE